MFANILQDLPMSSQPGRIDPPVTAASIRDAKDGTLADLRDGAVIIATLKGHQLGTWRDVDSADDVKVAYCQRCWRSAVIELVHAPHLAGPALTEVCQPRADAFLANQHEADLMVETR